MTRYSFAAPLFAAPCCALFLAGALAAPAQAQGLPNPQAASDAAEYADAKFVKPADGTLTATLTAQGTTDNGKSGEDHITIALNLTATSRLVYDRNGEHQHRTVSGTRIETHFANCDSGVALRPLKMTTTWAFTDDHSLPAGEDTLFGFSSSPKLRLGNFEGEPEISPQDQAPIAYHLVAETCAEATVLDGTTQMDYRLPLHGASHSAFSRFAQAAEANGMNGGQPLQVGVLTSAAITEGPLENGGLHGQYKVPVQAITISAENVQWNTEAAWKAVQKAGGHTGDDPPQIFPGTLTLSWDLTRRVPAKKTHVGPHVGPPGG